jgi:hypothetical protein
MTIEPRLVASGNDIEEAVAIVHAACLHLHAREGGARSKGLENADGATVAADTHTPPFFCAYRQHAPALGPGRPPPPVSLG